MSKRIYAPKGSSAQRGWLHEVAHRPEDAEREELYGLINDLEKGAYGFRMRRDLTSLTTQKLRDEAEYLSDRIRSDIESEEYDTSRREEREASESEIAGLMPTAAEMEQERMSVGKSARRYEGKMKITRSALARIIKEEVARALQEAMEVVNADSGEILTVDSLPPKYAGRLTKSDGYDALYDPDFEALRRDLELDPDVALDMLEEEAAGMYGEVQGDLGTAIDMAMGLKMSFPKEWKAALTTRRIKDMYYDDMDTDTGPEYDSIDAALARFLAERMG
jgi:hypothetical protein